MSWLYGLRQNSVKEAANPSAETHSASDVEATGDDAVPETPDTPVEFDSVVEVGPVDTNAAAKPAVAAVETVAAHVGTGGSGCHG